MKIEIQYSSNWNTVGNIVSEVDSRGMCKKATFFLSFVRPTFKAHCKNSQRFLLIPIDNNCFGKAHVF